MALPENLLLKVNIDPLRADPSIIKEDALSILTDEQDSKLVDIATLRKYDSVLRGTGLGEAFDTLKEIQTNIEHLVDQNNELATAISDEIYRAASEEAKLNADIDSEVDRATLEEEKIALDLANEIKRAEEAEDDLKERVAALEDDLKEDGATFTKIATAQSTADQGVADAATAQAAANAAQTDATSALNKLTIVQGADTVEGSIAHALKTAKGYTDNEIDKVEETINTLTQTVNTNAQTAAAATKAVADDLAAYIETNDDAVAAAKKAGDDAQASANAAQQHSEGVASDLADYKTANDARVKAIEDDYTTATQAGTIAQGKVDTFKTSVVDGIAERVSGLETTVGDANSGLVKALAEETARATGVESGLNTRLRTVEIFFEGAYTEEGKPLTEALDTLEEIQDYIDTHGEVAAKMISDISQNASNIDLLETWKQNHEEDHANKQIVITNAIKLAKEEAVEETLASIQLVDNTEIDKLFSQGGAG